MMADDGRDDGDDLERFREYLCLIARLQLDDRLQAKVDVSGVVQQTLWEARRERDGWGRRGEGSRIAWLRRILANNLIDEVRRFHAQSRDVGRERRLEVALAQSSSRLGSWLKSDQTSPSQGVIRDERLLQLAAALAQLPPDQRRVVELHHLQEQPLAAIARQTGRGKGAVAALLFRALRRLRKLLEDHDGG